MKPQIFVDMDGVLADFDSLAFKVLGTDSHTFEAKHGEDEFWRRLQAHGSFYTSLPPMPDARHLWEGCKQFGDPMILTGCPRGGWAETQKRVWAAAILDTDRIITCQSRNKRDHAKPGDILIDDWLKYRHLWVEKGGIFIHHKSASDSLTQLRQVFHDRLSPLQI